MKVTRRTLLGGMAAAAAWPAHAAPDPAGALLDAAAKVPAAEGVRMLASINAATLAPARRLDVQVARAGLAIQAQLDRSPGDYTLRLRRALGDEADPDAAARRLAAERDRLHARALPLFRQLGLTQGSVGERYLALWRDERWLYPDSDAGRAQAVADMNRWLAAARRRVPAAFPDVPGWCLDVSTRVLSAEEIAAGKNGYREAPAPGRAGAYIVDLKDIRRRPSWTLPSVVAHELLPGHMIQLGLENVTPPHPLRLTHAGAFVEGWGIYAEQLAADEGGYPTPEAMLGHLHWLLFRVCRALVDLGLHRGGWTPAQALSALIEWQGTPGYFAPFGTELARIAREPANRAAEALAWLAIADRAPRAASARQRFHAAVLANGRKRIEQLPRR